MENKLIHFIPKMFLLKVGNRKKNWLSTWIVWTKTVNTWFPEWVDIVALFDWIETFRYIKVEKILELFNKYHSKKIDYNWIGITMFDPKSTEMFDEIFNNAEEINKDEEFMVEIMGKWIETMDN